MRVHQYVAQQNPSAPLSEVQNKTLEMIRSLVNEGLCELGAMSGKNGRFVAWNVSLDESMGIIYDAYVTHFDDRDMRHWYCWLNLTDKGERIAHPLVKGNRDSGS